MMGGECSSLRHQQYRKQQQVFREGFHWLTPFENSVGRSQSLYGAMRLFGDQLQIFLSTTGSRRVSGSSIVAERESLSVLRAIVPFDDSELIAVMGSVIPEEDISHNAGRLDDQRVTFPMSDRMSEWSRCLVARSLAAIHIDCSTGVPFPVPEFKLVL